MPADEKSQAKKVRFLEGDALEVLRSIPASQFDLVVSSPPYNIGKDYERSANLSFDEYLDWLDSVIEALIDRLADTGSICWQVGSYIRNGEIYPLDIYFYNSFKKRGMRLRNRIVWRFNFGLHSAKRFSGRYETILWFTKSDNYTFNLDAVRVPQLYPGKRHPSWKEGAGSPSGNPRGKNPSDYWEFCASNYFDDNPIWDIPNVKANHPEKTFHPCQFPIELAERCILALTKPGGTVLDPFVGTGTSVIAAVKHNRIAVGIDNNPNYLDLARKRLKSFQRGELKMRPSGRAVLRVPTNHKVARLPDEWMLG
jgi:DNA modification methylase